MNWTNVINLMPMWDEVKDGKETIPHLCELIIKSTGGQETA